MAIREETAAQLSALEAVLSSVDEKALATFVKRITAARRVFVTGAGRTLRVMEAFATRLGQLDLDVHIAGAPTAPPVARGDLLIVASGSGATQGPLGAARIAKRARATVFAITANSRSALWRVADEGLRLNAPVGVTTNAPASLPLGTLFEESLFLLSDQVVARLMKRRRMSAADMAKRHANLE